MLLIDIHLVKYIEVTLGIKNATTKNLNNTINAHYDSKGIL